MAQLLVRKLDSAVVKALKLRAASRGTSAESEHREILREALLGPAQAAGIKEFIMSMPDVGDDCDFEFERDLPRDDGLSD